MTGPHASASTASDGWAASAPGGVGRRHRGRPRQRTAGDAATAAHLLEFDSVHGRWPERGRGRRLSVAGPSGTAAPSPVRCHGPTSGWSSSWNARGRSGAETLEPYFEQGVRKVVVAAPVKDGALNVVVGVNDERYDPDARHRHRRLLHHQLPGAGREGRSRGVRHRARLDHDPARHDEHAEWSTRRTRTCAGPAPRPSLIPTTTGSATAIGMIFPELEGKLNGLAVRVPLLNASLTDCVFEVARPTTVEEVNGLLPRRPTVRSGDPRLREAAAGVGRLQGRPALGDRRCALDDGHRRHPDEDPRLVRQRVGLRNRLVELAGIVGGLDCARDRAAHHGRATCATT